jgi:protein-S-isoprenylcysteine O-methyltransferase Ste14
MAINIKKISIISEVNQFFVLIISMAGYVPKNATIARTTSMLFSLAFAIYLGKFQSDNTNLAVVYFIVSEIFYLGFITIVLSENGIRRWFIRKLGNENDGYLAYEAVLGFLFFQNGVSIGYIASTTPANLFDFIPETLLITIVTIMFVSGFVIKILAAKAVTIDIYYWKDMFLGKKICDFVVTGPYKYFNNPMYGIGQMQAYATAIWYGSKYGLLAALSNQILIFLFYYLVEKKFIQRVYLGTELQLVPVNNEETK